MTVAHCWTDGEHIYSLDDVLHRAAEAFDLDPVTECSICERPLDASREIPICERCEGTARAHARLENDARRYPDPEARR